MNRYAVVCVLWVAALIVSSTKAQAEEPDKDPPVQIMLLWENDSSFISPLNPNDRYYTNGIRINLAFKPACLTDVLAALPFNPAGSGNTTDLETALGVSVGQSIFTPGDLKRSDLIENDRPYAGWLYGGVYVQRAPDTVLDPLEFVLGTTGQSALADETQKYIHETFDAIEPQGWRNQLADELGFNITYTRKWKLPVIGKPGRGGAVELIPQAGMTLGTINRQFDAAATLRGGWNLPHDFGPGRISDTPAATHIHRKSYSPGIYGYVRFGGRVVEHNTFIQGNTFRDSHGVDIEPLVGDFEGGFAAQVSLFGHDTLQAGWAHVVTTEQFKSQRGAAHNGRWTLMWTCHF